jgi:hypothetical protein
MWDTTTVGHFFFHACESDGAGPHAATLLTQKVLDETGDEN